MLILALETSCDETAAAVVEDGVHVRSNVIASSSEAFTRSGGVIPEEAARKQIECVLPVIDQALSQAGIMKQDLDAIAVTRGPGLLGSLLVGTVTARAIGTLWKIPVVGVHHLLGHLSSTWLESDPDDLPVFPLLALTASGGHTELWLRASQTRGQLLGRTRDDAAGEAFDKGAGLLGLPYPGGPSIAAAAESGDPKKFPFPLPLIKEDTLDFSFSGLKTALRYTIRDLNLSPESVMVSKLVLSGVEGSNHDLAASYQHALCAHLSDRLKRALDRHPEIREVHLVGGVSANRLLRLMAAQSCTDRTLRFPKRLSYCTDNAAMIAAAAEFMIQESGIPENDWETEASLPLTSAIQSS
ncbi:tRNA (adenosine(37)-N6)-threonylcarbamoyltransferase complex transferase subunit TsaD [Candidatus Peregrinibacteria bacterium]|nr:tRNA (adenosine(37)-N6)-threonylcarbamoyltransferase complex transferase subunit TsaD [Candidatus Peregrinibacteria bacterium]